MSDLNMNAHLIDGDVGDEQQHVDKRIEPVDQRPATAHYWSTGGAGHVPGWYKVAHDGEWWFWRTDRDCWLHAPCPEDAVLCNLVALPPLDTATHFVGSYYFRLNDDGWYLWNRGSKQWITCDAPNPGSVDRVIHPGLKHNASETPNSSNHIPDAGKMVGNHSVEPNEKVSMAELYPDYYRDVRHLDEIDVYAVHDTFRIDDPSGCLQHASKKILLSGTRNGGKSLEQDIKEARDTLTRKLQLMGVE